MILPETDVSLLTDEELARATLELQQQYDRLEPELRYDLWEPKPHQVPWFYSAARMVIVCGPNRGGKTESGLTWAIAKARGRYPRWFHNIEPEDPRTLRGRRVIICGSTIDQLKLDIGSKLEERIPDSWLARPPGREEGLAVDYKFKWGTHLRILTYRQPNEVYEGWPADACLFNEPPPKDKYIAIRTRLLERNGEMFFSMTPRLDPWIMDDIIVAKENPDSPLHDRIEVFNFEMHDCCRECNGGHIDHDEIMAFEAELSEEERASRVYGKFMVLAGAEFAKIVSPETHVVPDFRPPAAWPICETVDPHPKKGLYVVWDATNEKEETFVFHAKHIPGGAFSQMCDDLRRERMLLPHQPDRAIMDQRGGAARINLETQETWFDAFRRLGFHYQRSRDVPMQTLHEWLRPEWLPGMEGPGVPRLRFTKSVAQMEKGPLWALTRYVYDPEESGKRQRDQPGKDWVDCLRYRAGQPGLSYSILSQGRTPFAGAGDVRPRSLAATFAPKRPVAAGPGSVPQMRRMAMRLRRTGGAANRYRLPF